MVEFVDVFDFERDAGGVGAFGELGDLGGGRVDPGSAAGPGHRDVHGLAVQAGRTDDVDLFTGDALGLVDGGRVAVVDVPVEHVAGVESQVAAVGQADVQAV